MATVLVIDNYDSFTYNLVQMFLACDLSVVVSRSDEITLETTKNTDPDFLVIGPGPKDPASAHRSLSLIKNRVQTTPILGVCLGMQCINEVFGGTTVRAKTPVHGKTSRVHHNGQALFAGLPDPFEAARYHSLAVALPPAPRDTALVVTATSDDGTIMGISHRHLPVHGVQFHPESFMTEGGLILIKNFLGLRAVAGRAA